jgi:hypothetical protein
MNEEMERTWKHSWPNQGIILSCARRISRKSQNTSFRMGVLSVILSAHFLSI